MVEELPSPLPSSSTWRHRRRWRRGTRAAPTPTRPTPTTAASRLRDAAARDAVAVAAVAFTTVHGAYEKKKKKKKAQTTRRRDLDPRRLYLNYCRPDTMARQKPTLFK